MHQRYGATTPLFSLVTDSLISQNVFINYFQSVDSPTKLSTYGLLLLIEILSEQCCGGVDFLKLSYEYIFIIEVAGSLAEGAAGQGRNNLKMLKTFVLKMAKTEARIWP